MTYEHDFKNYNKRALYHNLTILSSHEVRRLQIQLNVTLQMIGFWL